MALGTVNVGDLIRASDHNQIYDLLKTTTAKETITFSHKGVDLASAATLTLGTDGNYFHVTGTTGITAISSANTGTAVFLEFDGALTLTHNAISLILAGSVNYTTSAGDVIGFISEGSGNWREIFRATAGGTDISALVNNVKAHGAVGDGTTDDTSAIQTTLNLTGITYFPSGTYKVTSNLSVPDATWMLCAPGATIALTAASVVFGSTSAVRYKTGCDIRVQGTAAAGKALVEGYNLLGDHSFGPRQIVVTLSATTTSDLFHAHSVSAHGYADVKHVISTSNFQCANGITLMNGDDATTASLAGDFVNGNSFEGTLSVTGIGIKHQGTGPVAGSVNAPIARNKFYRMDVNSFGTAGYKAMDAGPTRNEFDTCTFEVGSGGATLDVDTHLSANGQVFWHPVCRTKSTQSLVTRDVWLFDEFDNNCDFGIYQINSNSGVPVTKQVGSGTRTAGDLTSTAGGALADATDVTTTITLPTGTTGKVLVTVSGSFASAGAGGTTVFDIVVDGTAAKEQVYGISSTGDQALGMEYLATGLSAASHTFKLQWRTITANATLRGGTVSTRTTSIVAREL